MAPAVRVFRQFQASNTRLKAVTLTGLAGLVLALAFLMGVFPAIAESDGPDVDPTFVEYGGGDGACAFVESAAEHELHLNNPQTGEFTGPDGTTEFSITVDGNFLDFEVLTPGMGVYDVVINGGEHNNHYDYDDNGNGPVTKDDGLHAPLRGGGNGPPHNLSHTNICYDELPLGSVSGTKYHDNDADGTLDDSGESEIEGWTIAAFDLDGNFVGSDDTDSDGFYKIDNLAPDTYTICEQTDTSGLPSESPEGVTWAWTQSEPSGDDVCSGFSQEGEDGVTYLPLGYSVEINGNDVENIDFGNHRQVTVECGTDAIDVTLGGEDEPTATVTFPADCDSESYTTSFDLGLSDDGDDWNQFVVFGGDPTSTQELEQTIVWAPELAEYNDQNELVIPTTQVLLDLTDTTSEPVDVTFCHTDSDLPDSETPQCLDSRLIAEGGDVPDDHIQLTETYKLLGDPGNFR